MKSYSKTILAIIAAAAATAPAAAVPAKPGLLTVTQADGTALNVRLMGDEHSHFYLSEDGYLLANDADTYYYADIDDAGRIERSNIRATPAAVRDGVARSYLQAVDMDRVREKLTARARKAGMRRAAAGPGLFPGTHFPATGHQKAIVILVEYTDTKFQTSYDPHDYFYRMLNEPGFSDYGGTGSAVDFFKESSMEQFLPEFDLYGPVTLSQKMSYYGGNDYSGNDRNPEQMVIEACRLLDSTVDFSQYDRDGDGYIDNVFIFYAGRGEASGGSSDTVWPHSWNVTAASYETHIFDGVQLDRYACSNEWEGTRPDGVGTFVHEFSHVMGLPDLYATSYTGAFTPGAWSTMDYGPYNNNGCTPPLYSAFERYSLGWIEPLPVTEAVNATLRPIGTNQAGIIRTASANEYFLIENRQPTSWDTYLPGHGMLVWHVDYNSSVWSANRVNNTSSHQYVDIEEADGTRDEYSRGGDAFPGTAGITSFTDDTTPSMKTWNGTRLGLPITDIAESPEGIITFKVCGGREPLEPTVADEPAAQTHESFTATWESAGPDAEYVLNVYTRPQSRATGISYVKGYEGLRVGTATSWEVTGLEPETEYCYTVSVGGGWEESVPSNEITVSTGRTPLPLRAVVADEATAITSGSFTATWLPLADAESYTVSVCTKEWGAPLADVCDFTGGVAAMPDGWVSTGSATYANTAYSGLAVPSLRLSTAADVLTTPVYTDGVHGISFWHRGNGTAPDDRLLVDALANGKWTGVAELEIVTAQGGATVRLDQEIPAGTTQLRISCRRSGTKGACAIDDITVLYGNTFASVPVDGLTDYPAGTGTECLIDGLAPSTTYYYTVRAIGADGALSLPSQEIAVTTEAPNSGISDITAPGCDAPAEYYNLQGVRVATPTPGGIYIRRQGSTVKKILFR